MGIQGSQWGTTINGITKAQQRTWGVILRNPGLGAKAVAEILGVSREAAGQHLKALTDLGLLDLKMTRGSGRWTVSAEGTYGALWRTELGHKLKPTKFPVRNSGKSKITEGVIARRNEILEFLKAGPKHVTDIRKHIGSSAVNNDLSALRRSGDVHIVSRGVYAHGPEPTEQ